MSLDPTENAQFNQLHPRAAAGAAGLKPGQFAPKSEAEKLQDEASKEAEFEQMEAEENMPAGSTTVQVGNAPEAAQEAVADDHADNLRKCISESEPGFIPNLIVVFGNRADATKFAIARDHFQGTDATTKVTAAANGAYNVDAGGLLAVEVDAIQEMVHRGTSLDQITREAVSALLQERLDRPEDEERAYLMNTVTSGQVGAHNLDEVGAMEKAISSLSQSDVLSVSEAIHYGSFRGLHAAATHDDPELAARALLIMDLVKGNLMSDRKPLLLMPVKNTLADKKHDPNENDGKAQPLGTTERITATVGSEENITEHTAKYPKTGHKANRRPRIILNR